jgi:uncharacterized protein YaaW (UPF0174 family)
MPEAIELPLEVDDAPVSGLIGQLKALKKSSEETGKTLRNAFAAETLGQSLNRVGDAFGGVTKQVTTAASAILQGFLQGGPVGAALGGVSVLVNEVAESFRQEAIAAEKAAEARRKVLEAEKQRLDDVNTRLAETLRLRNEELRILGQGGAVSETEKAVALDKANEKLRDAQRETAKLEAEERKLFNERSRLDKQLFVLGDGAPEKLKREREAIRLRLEAIRGEAGEIARARGAESAADKELQDLAERFRREDEAASQEARDKEEQAEKAAAEERRKRKEREAADLLEVNRKYEEEIRRREDKALAEQVERDAKRFETFLRTRLEKLDAEAAALREEADAEIEINQIVNERIAKDEQAVIDETFEEFFRDAEERERVDEDVARAKKARAEREKSEQQERHAMAQTVLRGTADLVDTVVSLGDAQKNATKIELEEQAKRATVKAIMAGAEAAIALYFQDYRGAALAGLAAAQFAIVAGGSYAASSDANSGGDRTPPPRDSATGSASRGGRSGGSGGGGGNVFILQAGTGLLLTRDEVSRDVQRLMDQRARRN